jgi:hypothetical protein
LKRRTLEKALYPNLPDPEFIDRWARDYSDRIMEKVWEACDSLQTDLADAKVDVSRKELLDLENSLTGMLVKKIRDVMKDYSPYWVDRESPERETMKETGGRPPTYDIAFVLNENQRLKWPLEAKVLEEDTTSCLNAYVNDIDSDFLTCRYAPLSGEGAMIGYLLKGEVETVFGIIEKRLSCSLVSHSSFGNRNHKLSAHRRTHERCLQLKSPADFKCHHLILAVNAVALTPKGIPTL